MGFAESMKERQREGADDAGVDPRMFDDRWDRSWVLRAKERERNVYRSRWCAYIRGREHRSSRALTWSGSYIENLRSPGPADVSHSVRGEPDRGYISSR